VAETAVRLGIAHALVIQGPEGSDDLPVTRDSRVCEVRNGQIFEWAVDLEALGLERRAPAVMECSGLGHIIRRLAAALTGEPGPDRDAIILNAALRLYLAGRTASLKDGLIYARELLDSGSTPQPSNR
jgi:anthranilate phosphoribosyltransferase